MRERRYFLIAEKYGQSPAQVRAWSDYDFCRAWMNIEAESDPKITKADVEEAKKKRPMARKAGFILDCDYTHWQKFIVDGQLDSEKLTAGGYTGEQAPGIEEEMNKLGWLEQADEPERTTGPLEQAEEQPEG